MSFFFFLKNEVVDGPGVSSRESSFLSFLSLCLPLVSPRTTLTLAVSRDLLRALTTSSWCAISLMFLGRLCADFFVCVEVEEVEVETFEFLMPSQQTSFFPSSVHRLSALSIDRALFFPSSPFATTKRTRMRKQRETHYLSTQGWAVIAAIVFSLSTMTTSNRSKREQRERKERRERRDKRKLLFFLLLLCGVLWCTRACVWKRARARETKPCEKRERLRRENGQRKRMKK